MSFDRQKAAQLLTLALLVTIGVVGRWGQPDWCVTPLAAVGLLAGYAAPSVGWAIAVPIVAVAISNLLLPAYQTLAVAITVYGSFGASALIGRWLRTPIASKGAGLARLTSCAVLPATLFFLTTNFGVWASQGIYAKTPAGLMECYTAALPFFRRMLAGDLAYTAVLFAAAAAAGVFTLAPRGKRLVEADNVAARS